MVNVLPLLRDFAEKINLHFIWLKARPQYEDLAARVHDPMTRMILDTNIYLHQPVSSYDGRRFLVLLEPMLSPSLTNARIYGSDYIIVTSPDNTPVTTAAGVPVTPSAWTRFATSICTTSSSRMVYSRSSAMDRIQPLLRGVQDAPLEFFYKSDVEALITECLIKAIEARTYETLARPKKPSAAKERAEIDQYNAEELAYERETALARDKLVAQDESQGWVLPATSTTSSA